jgi:mRNA interferase MazF
MRQRDGESKPRPVLILKLMPPYGDLLICGISTQLHQEAKGFDEIISFHDQDFEESQLRLPSLIRLVWIETVPDSAIKGAIGTISSQRLNRLISRLASYLIE